MDTNQNEQGLPYGHMALSDRRDSTISNNISTPYQGHQGLNHALGHLSRPAFNDGYRLSASPPPPLNHSPLQTYNAAPGSSNKRPAPHNSNNGRGQEDAFSKRRRAVPPAEDDDGEGHGAKHWSEEEKTRLFQWLMGPGEDDHWNALRSAKNSCLRDCASEVFGNKKTYQALKGCYERNFAVFKQIYALESFASDGRHGPGGGVREHDARLHAARKAGVDVGTLNARTVDHWHRNGWYQLFLHRWNGDPATTRPVVHRASTAGPGAQRDDEPDDYPPAPHEEHHPHSTPHHTQAPPLPPLQQQQPPPPPLQQQQPPPQQSVFPATLPPPPPPPASAPPTSASVGAGAVGLPVAGQSQGDAAVQTLLSAIVPLLNAHLATSRAALELARRREEREEREAAQRAAAMRRAENDAEEGRMKAKVERATEVMANPAVGADVKKAAGEFLKRMFLE